MFESPRSLQEVCVDFICDNVLALCEFHSSNSGSTNSNPIPTAISKEGRLIYNTTDDNSLLVTASSIPSSINDINFCSLTRLDFKDPDIFLPAQISEQLLASLCEKKALSDLTITLFDSRTTILRHVRLKDASSLSVKGLKILKQHKIIDLEVNGLRITINDLIGCLGQWSLDNLRSLSVAKGSFIDCSRVCVFMALSKLRALHTLNVSGTEFNKHGLEIIVEDLPLLESLDISCTRVDDITPLKKCKNRLKSLAMYNLKITGYGNLRTVFMELNLLRILDISDEKDSYTFEMFAPIRSKITDLLRAVNCMPDLSSLDISGKDEIEVKDLKEFLKNHPHLEFLGLVHSDACYEDSLINSANKDYRPGLIRIL